MLIYLLVSSSETEKNKWLHDMKSAIENLKMNTDDHKSQYTATMKSNGKNRIEFLLF